MRDHDDASDDLTDGLSTRNEETGPLYGSRIIASNVATLADSFPLMIQTDYGKALVNVMVLCHLMK